MQSIEFVDIVKKDHIDSVLNKIFKGSLALQIWQKEEPLRQKTNGKLKSINAVSNHIELEASDFDGFVDFKKDEIFFYSNYRMTIFKSKILKKIQGNKVIIEYPELLKIKEARSNQRHRYGLHTNHRLDILLVAPNGAKMIETEVRIIDSSDNGFAILIPKKYGELVKKGTKIIVLEASILHLSKRAGIVRTFMPFKNNLTGENTYRVGIELKTR